MADTTSLRSSPPSSPSSKVNLPTPFLPKAISNTNAHIIHLSRLLSSTAHLDSLLALLTYTTRFLSTTGGGKGPFSVSIQPSLRALSALLSDLRSSLRLFGLLGIYAWGLSIWSSPPTDPVLRGIAWAEVVANAVFQTCENVAVLAEKGVLRRGGWDGPTGNVRKKRFWLWSSRAWMVHVGLEVGRLVRVWGLGQKKKKKRVGGGEGEGEGEGVREEKGVVVRDEGGDEAVVKIDMEMEKEKAEGEKWWRDLIVNAAYAPMTMHWSVEDGILTEPWLGALGLVATGIGFRQVWRDTS